MSKAPAKKPRKRAGIFDPNTRAQLAELAAFESCLTWKQIAGKLGCTTQCIDRWRKHDPDFFDALDRNERGEILRQIEFNLFRAALDGNVTAQIFALKNLAPERWRDKHEIEHSGNVTLAHILTEARQRLEQAHAVDTDARILDEPRDNQ